MPYFKPHWSPDADFSSCPFFIRRMDTVGFFKPSEAPVAQLPLVGFIYITSGEVLVEIDRTPFLCQPGQIVLIPQKQSTGRSVGAWIDIVRIQRAKRLLSSTDLSIIDIATSVGVEDQSYFSRLFKKEAGITPSAYRKKMHG